MNAEPVNRVPCTRDDLIASLRGCSTALEIGPFDRPVLAGLSDLGCRVSYADFLSSAELRERAAISEGRDPNGVPTIDYVLRTEPLALITQRFDAVASFHCAEHQPDLIRHFQEVLNLLVEGGQYLCVLPDKRHCFDFFMPVSELPEIMAAYYEGRTKPPLRSVIEHRAFTSHEFMHSPPDPFRSPDWSVKERTEHAVTEFNSHEYVDVHCWYFTPDSVRSVVRGLRTLGFLPATLRFDVYEINGVEIALILRM